MVIYARLISQSQDWQIKDGLQPDLTPALKIIKFALWIMFAVSLFD
ncbi:hypothetical protein ACBC71_004797 [Salmonella enterica subsp. enterica serovar Albany]|nr:hypothetical protein [Salmonella enterica subsp. enterica]EDU0349287.1 hypothetical protein [Salmonella enterica subsp. enterica serovar Albany]EDW3016974.1 hypothetical protein [Salmonella enterica]EDW7706261.1 hypothetical protein [Salmonella enterica subsp. enterica]EDX7268047.1 hypothetical protein [Salmonella enterica subsp. enterica serovar Albany]